MCKLKFYVKVTPLIVNKMLHQYYNAAKTASTLHMTSLSMPEYTVTYTYNRRLNLHHQMFLPYSPVSKLNCYVYNRAIFLSRRPLVKSIINKHMPGQQSLTTKIVQIPEKNNSQIIS